MSATLEHPGDAACLCHIIPLGDFREHEVSAGCWCGPQPLPDCPDVLQHRALDQRELIEDGRRLLQ